MTNNDAGKFRGSWMFDTHNAEYYLDNDNNIIWIQCDKISDKVIWIQSNDKVVWFIGNPWVRALKESTEDMDDVYRILQELNATYKEKIIRWLGEENIADLKQEAA